MGDGHGRSGPGIGIGIGSTLGRGVASVAASTDTIVTAGSHPDVDRASGPTSPYPYLWSLPARTLDPRQVRLEGHQVYLRDGVRRAQPMLSRPLSTSSRPGDAPTPTP